MTLWNVIEPDNSAAFDTKIVVQRTVGIEAGDADETHIVMLVRFTLSDHEDFLFVVDQVDLSGNVAGGIFSN